jgi:hypothetical protein
MKHLLMGVLLAGLVPALAIQGTVSGEWRADSAPIRMKFQVDGNKLSGAVSLGESVPLPIQNGKVDRDVVSFHLADDSGGKIAFTGKVEGESIKFAVVGKKFPKEFIAKRMK